MLFYTVVNYWLFFGISFILAEFFITGIGLLFIGLGALLNAVLLHIYPHLADYQYISFGLLSFATFIILWYPLKKYSHKSSVKSHNFNIIGSVVYVADQPLAPEHLGVVLWSGVQMNAKLSSKETEVYKVGEKLYVKEIQGNILICERNG